ncbi:RPAP1-like protein [Lipomyces kononenkoae]|uniref:RPAP1-like protein n=1 Tax=Lipomyces kononenkoae TaxID=34357 RepID=A0ACC3T9Y6_LIPKO
MDIVHDVIERPMAKRAERQNECDPVSQPLSSRRPKSLWRSRVGSNRAQQGSEHQSDGSMATAASTSEAAKINKENMDRIEGMTTQEIEAEKAALEALLPPGLISRILKRDPSAADAILMNRSTETFDDSANNDNTSAQQSDPRESPTSTEKLTRVDGTPEHGDVASSSARIDPTTAGLDSTPRDSTHFPAPVSVELDPDAPDFLELLHKKYFPDLPADPSRLAWMKPVTVEEDGSSPYNPQQESVSPADIRFDFHGDIIPPSKSASLPATLGLHHHSDSPGFAGYTIPELSHLCRSAVAAQRAIAVQVIGRILYKLGINYYGEYVGDALWDIVEHTRVIESIYEAADDKKTHHLGLRTCAVEALWLWKKGGGRRRKTD